MKTEHRWASRSLGSYLDRELPPSDEAVVRSHLADCPGCRKEAAVLSRIKSSLRKLADLTPEGLRIWIGASDTRLR